ncbi:tripartite tricarboxylate transporter permease [Mesorhizobium sp. WSM4303]|uniref:tripartite tricarboxylate transporter permease n=1 Tax=unclassified Mesorhizobium TaxID=325217 RepID=UPI00115C625A|nr:MULTISPECIES: tripartite tricarboxylate transporter permease [unclassified Mesorhizobium]TRC96005.1 tripartite tricarboxylate transporter permease [Mesorhizobium sp. WSM4306]TRC99957.1 tripartite tricarboxylate transporter permease [Mesorhizobium sp. WSM4303]
MDLILTAIAEMAQPFRMLMLVTGVFAGLVVGVVPGIGGLFAMALLIPMTYNMDPYAAFALLLGMGSVTTTSDTIPAILFGVPGSVGAAATVLDGHAMAKKGEAARAFGASYSASMIGGVFGALMLAAAIPVMRPLVLYLKTPDFFAICAFGLSIVAILAGSQPLKGLAAAMLGMLASFIGIDSIAGVERWSFGQIYLWDGLPISLVFLGLFGLPELASLLMRGSIQGNAERPTYAGMWQGIRDTLREWPLVLRCSAIGSLLGAVPGIGIAVLDWIAYGHASRRPGPGPKFGQGNVRGVIAPESANNAKEGGSLIPTIAFGVPGSASMSILLGAFVIHGLVPGPDMLGKNAAITVSMVLSIAVANIVGAVTCLLLTRQLARIAQVSAAILVPLVITFIVVGAYQTNMSAFDFLLVMLVGAVGMAMKELNWPRSAFSLGFVLGPSLENYFFLAYQISGWAWLKQPLVLILLGLAIAGVVRQTVSWIKARGNADALPPALPDIAASSALTLLGVSALVTALLDFPFEAAIFPAITAGLLALFSLLTTIQTMLRWRKPVPASGADVTPVGEWQPSDGPAMKGNLTVLGLCLALAFLVLLAGHLTATFVFVAGGIWMLGSRSLNMTLAVAAGTTLCIYAVFDLLASQPWPAPWLAGLVKAF